LAWISRARERLTPIRSCQVPIGQIVDELNCGCDRGLRIGHQRQLDRVAARPLSRGRDDPQDLVAQLTRLGVAHDLVLGELRAADGSAGHDPVAVSHQQASRLPVAEARELDLLDDGHVQEDRLETLRAVLLRLLALGGLLLVQQLGRDSRGRILFWSGLLEPLGLRRGLGLHLYRGRTGGDLPPLAGQELENALDRGGARERILAEDVEQGVTLHESRLVVGDRVDDRREGAAGQEAERVVGGRRVHGELLEPRLVLLVVVGQESEQAGVDPSRDDGIDDRVRQIPEGLPRAVLDLGVRVEGEGEEDLRDLRRRQRQRPARGHHAGFDRGVGVSESPGLAQAVQDLARIDLQAPSSPGSTSIRA
jgi:hypothetical protein